MAEPAKLTLMAVHAHPDDESIGTGGTLAHYSDEGVTTVVVTCTNGEYGDGPGHVKPGEDGHDPEQVAKTRYAELKEACARLGVTHLEMLGYRDSGMADWPYKDQDDAFCNIPVEESAGRLLALVDRYRPDVIVTYHNLGGYNHPDHLQAHRVAVEAFQSSIVPSKLYFIANRRRDFERLRERMEAAGMEPPARQQRTLSPEMLQRMAEIEKLITTTVDTSAVAKRKSDAIAAHASQVDESWWVRLPDDTLDGVFASETFILAEDRIGTSIPEDDLFAGRR